MWIKAELLQVWVVLTSVSWISRTWLEKKIKNIYWKPIRSDTTRQHIIIFRIQYIFPTLTKQIVMKLKGRNTIDGLHLVMLLVRWLCPAYQIVSGSLWIFKLYFTDHTQKSLQDVVIAQCYTQGGILFCNKNESMP